MTNWDNILRSGKTGINTSCYPKLISRRQTSEVHVWPVNKGHALSYPIYPHPLLRLLPFIYKTDKDEESPALNADLIEAG